MIEKRWIVSKSDWHVEKFLQRTYAGFRPDHENFLLKSRHEACSVVKQLPLRKQEEYRMFQVDFDPEKVIKHGKLAG